MANEEVKENRALNQKINALNDRLDDIYKTTFSSDPTARDMFSTISDDIYNSVTNILSTNSDIRGLPDVAQLYARIDKKQGGPRLNGQVFDSLSDLFNDGSLMNTIMANPEINRYIKSKDLQIDMILKYMPKLAAALDIKKDNVLLAENFSKSFIRVENAASSMSDDELDTFAMQANEVIRKYNLEEKFEDMYDETAKYGEQFIYLVPYKTAFERLRTRRDKSTISTFPVGAPMQESVILESGKITDSKDIEYFRKSEDGNNLLEDLKNINTTVKLTFNESSTIRDAITEAYNARNVLNYSKKHSIKEQFMNEANSNKSDSPELDDKGKPVSGDRISPRAAKYKLDKIAPDELEYDKLYDKANDGLVLTKTKDSLDGKIDDIPGCIFKPLKRCDVIPIYIEGICMGYYYLEFSYIQNEDIDRSRMLLNDTFESITNHDMREDNDMIIKYIASKISSEIDAHFINANQDLKNEIYAVLKYDQRFNTNYDSNIINVTYLPPTDVYHFYFKLDNDLHRGISDLEGALMPALFWVLLTLSTTMGIATRSNDHRVIYVRQNVETNIAKTLMNVINQLKKGNMGIRQMQSMNNILGIIGKYNDYIIPVGPSGDAPVTFDTIQGQDIKTPEELLNKFEENAVNSTDVPIEMVNATMNVDYATRFTMANSRFLRKILKRQEVCERKFTEIFSLIYNYEYQENEKLLRLKLPEPIFLNSVNGLAMLNNVKDYVNAIAEIAYPQGSEFDEADKAEFTKKYTERILGSYLDMRLIHSIVEEIEMDKNLIDDKVTSISDNPEEGGGEGEGEGGEGEEELGI